MKGCFVYLVNHTTEALADMRESLALLDRNHPSGDRIFFHEPELPTEAREQMGERGRLVEVRFEVPGWINKTDVCGQRLGYMHMCRFWAGLIFGRSELDGYDYYCRLDTDSRILSPVGYDLFERADGYAYIDDSIVEHPPFRKGLWELAESFWPGRTLPPRGSLYYTNFEICNIAWFRDNWPGWFRAVDLAGGIYFHRWGDHTIRRLGVDMMMESGQIHRERIHYHHTYEYNKRMLHAD